MTKCEYCGREYEVFPTDGRCLGCGAPLHKTEPGPPPKPSPDLDPGSDVIAIGHRATSGPPNPVSIDWIQS